MFVISPRHLRHEVLRLSNVVYFETVFQFCSDLVDLIVCVGRHRGGGHRFSLARKRFVGLVAKYYAQVGDRGLKAIGWIAYKSLPVRLETDTYLCFLHAFI